MHVKVFADSGALAQGAADFITDHLTSTEGRSDIALAGGSTPEATYGALQSRPIAWETVDVWLSDERWVPHDSDESNGLMADAALVANIGPVELHRPRYSEHLDPEDSAAFYEAEIRSLVHGSPDLVLLGMGTDGHVASLFPGTAALVQPSDRWFVANHVPELDVWRLTVTPHLLRKAKNVAVIVSGTPKSSVLAEAVERPSGKYPIELLHEASGEVTILADRDATSQFQHLNHEGIS